MTAARGGEMAGPGKDEDESTQTAMEYADPVDPWAAAEAEAIAAGGRPSYEAPPVNPGQTRTAVVEPRPRRIGLLIGGVAAVVTAGVAAAAVLLWPDYPALDFHRVEEVARYTPAVPFTSSFTAADVVGDRAYFAGVDQDGTLRVLATGIDGDDKPLWEQTVTGQTGSWTSMRATPSVVVLYSGTDSVTRAKRVVVLDAEDGTRLWEQAIGISDTVDLGADTALWTDRDHQRLVGLGLTDGAEKWSEAAENIGVVLPVTTPDTLTGPAAVDGGIPWTGDVDRFLQFDTDRTATVRDLKTGKALQTRENVSNGDKAAISDGRLYTLETGTPKRIFQYDLANLAAEPGTLYTAAKTEEIDTLAPCGDQLCFLRTTGYDRATSQIVAVGGTGWTVPAPETRTLVPIGDNGLLAAGNGQTALIVDRKTVWTLTDGAVARLDAGNVLRFSDEPSNTLGNRTLSGFHLGDDAGEISELGEIRDVRSGSCSWNTTVIACVAEKDVVVHTFAG